MADALGDFGSRYYVPAADPQPVKAYEVWLKRMYQRGMWVKVADSAEASKVVRDFINNNNDPIGSSAFQGGEVRRVGERRAFAHVSYNGRVWEGTARKWTADTKEVAF